MAMMERLILQVFERKKWIVDQVKHQTRLFDQHLASTLLIDGIDPPEWLIWPQPSEFKKEEFIMGLLQRPSQVAIPDSRCCRSVNDEVLSLENYEKYPVGSCNDVENVIDICDRCGELSVLPEGMENGALDVESGPHSAEYTVFSPSTRNKAETSGISHDLELSLARLQRSKTRQQTLELRNSAKASESPSHDVKSKNFEGNEMATFEIACQSKISTPSSKKCCAEAPPVHVPGSCIRDGGKNSVGNKIGISEIVCQTDIQYVEFRTSLKCSADVQLVHMGETGDEHVTSYKGNPISEMPIQQKIYIDRPEVHSLFRDSGEAMPLPMSLSGSDCFEESFGRTNGDHAEVQEAIKGNLGHSCNNMVRSINCSENVLRSQRSTCGGDVDDVIKFDDSCNGKKGKTCHECMPQSTPLDHLQEVDERCGVDRAANEVCRNSQHESASKSLMELRRISYVSDNEKIVEMDVSFKTGELLVEGSSYQASEESKPLVCPGCQSIESRSITPSQQVSKSAANLQNVPRCNTDLEGYVEDSSRGFLPSMNLAKVASLMKSEMGADGDEFTKDTEVLVSSSNSPPNMILECKQLKFDSLGGSIVSMDMDSTRISKEEIHGSYPLRQTSVKQWDDNNEGNSREVSFEDHHDKPIQIYTLPKRIIDSSDHINLVDPCSIPDSTGGESLGPAIGGLSTNRFDEGKTTNKGEQEEPCADEQRQANSLRSEEGHEADAEPALQENMTFCRIIGSSSSHLSDLVAEDQNDIVLERFVMATDDDRPYISEDSYNFKTQTVENVTTQNWRIAELLSKSTCLNTPLQHHFMGNTDNQVSRLFQSVPNGLLEHADLRNSLATNDGKLVDHAFDGRSYSDCLPYCQALSTRNNRKPYSSPVGKLWESIHLNSGSSKQKPSLITELPSIIEEIELADEAVDESNEGISVAMVSARREPLAEISEEPNIPVYDNNNEMAIFSLDSTMTEATFPTTNRKLRETHKKRQSKKREVTRKVEGRKSSESQTNGVKRAGGSPKNKLAPPITSSKNGGPGISGKEYKLHNIVSNITSFLPLVQQKQAAAPGAGKRNVKVKALEAAEAAKRQAEKKELGRKMKKEALKLERERVEKENMRRFELEQKRKDEERKKKEAEMALKKRPREEEDKREKEKEKKKKRVEEPCRNRADRHEISCAGKEQPEVKDLAPDVVLMEELRVDSGKQVMDDGDRKVGNLDDLSDTTAGPVGRETLSSMEHDEENDNPEPSYEISPYKCSDYEDEEEDDMPRDKFIPSWARKRSIVQDVFYQKRLDPHTIFPPDGFCSISEVVLPLKHQLK